MVTDSFGEWVKRRRRALGLTQKELADRVGCSTVAIVKIERDERRPSLQIAEMLARQLAIPPEQQALFLEVARGERRVERLDESAAAPARPPLPALTTPLLGREAELEEIERLLGDPACRLLTLVGPGGVGKSHLALAAAARLGGQGGEVIFVPLAPLSSAGAIPHAIAEAMQISFAGPADPLTQLLGHLRRRGGLLVLDSLEHLAEAGPALAEILAGAPQARIIATSRERLNLVEEWAYEIGGLAAPPAGPGEAPATAIELERYGASALFLQSARQARPGLTPSATECQAIAQICQLVGGLPLALKLAASWARVLSCAEIAREIERNLDFLSSTARNMPERHRSLRATFDHSWQLLTPEERRALRVLSVFRGGFDRAAAEQVGGASLASLTTLIDKSLLRRSESGRFDLLEVVRQYAALRLAEDPAEQRAVTARFSAYYAGLLGQRLPGILGPQQATVVAELSAEAPNLELMWAWAAEQRAVDDIMAAADTLIFYHEFTSQIRQGAEVFRRAAAALDRPDAPDEPAYQLALGTVLAHQGYFEFRISQFAAARAALGRATAILRRIGDAQHLAMALSWFGFGEMSAGNLDAAEAHLGESLAMLRASGFSPAIAFVLLSLGMVASTRGDYHQARWLLSEALALTRQAGDARAMTNCLSYLGLVCFALGEHDVARNLLGESLAVTRARGDRFGTALALNYLGQIAIANRETMQALALLLESEALFEEMSDVWSLAQVRTGLGNVALLAGDPAEARESYRRAVFAAGGMLHPHELEAIAGLAEALAALGRDEAALEAALYVAGHPARGNLAAGRAEALRAALEARLPAAAVAEARERIASAGIVALITGW